MITHTLSNKDLPIFEFDISEEIDLVEIKQTIFDYKNKFPISRRSQANVWHSSYFTHLKDSRFQPLINLVEQKMNTDVSLLVCSKSLIKGIWTVLESWALTYDKYSYVDTHNHFNLGYSSICYISAENCSSIYFNDYEIVPVTGKLLFFPGCLKHRVAPNLPANGERIAFSCNLYPVWDYTQFMTKAKESSEGRYDPYC